MDLHDGRNLDAATADASSEAARDFDIVTRTQAVADIAAGHALSVDRDAAFPADAIAAAKRNGLMALLVPTKVPDQH